MFYGQYHIKIDIRRRRFRIPAAFMKEFDNEEIIIEKNVFLPCLDLFPYSVFKNKMNNFKKRINVFEKEGDEIMTAFFANFYRVESGKKEIYLPVDFYNHLEPENETELVLTGMYKSLRLMVAEKMDKELDKTKYMDLLKQLRSDRF
jgi:MraZ protein